jgi:hypothetical protein
VTPMNSDVNYVIGKEAIINQGLRVFSDPACDFLDDLSKAILTYPESKAYPDLVSFGFWIRKANVQKLKSTYLSQTNRLGRGLCFHIAPSNIPINFAFSFVFSLLAGNSNVVRLPSQSFLQVELLMDLIHRVIKDHPEISARTAFVKYPRDSDATSAFSKVADARMIWGGDETIRQVRKLETKPRATDIAFADRYSLCLIDAEKILKLNESDLKKLALDFYNDTYLMDQNACSSPQLIYWLNSSEEAKNRFWQSVFDVTSQKYQLQDAVAVDKYTKLCEDSIILKDMGQVERAENLVYRVNLNEVGKHVENLRGKGGYFYEYNLKNLDELMSVVTDKYQTITYFGVNSELIQQAVIDKHIRGIDRIVPIGKAMDIDIVWDGHDLILELSREIVLK